MARYSDPQFAVAPNANRFFVWDDEFDQYNHNELAANWDRLDAIVGRPSDNAAWPPSQGLGGGLFAQINLLMQDRTPLGQVIDWWFPFTGVENAAAIEALIPSGYAICDGRQVIDHSFPAPYDGAFYAPDLVNAFILGATINKVPGTAAPTYINPGQVTSTYSAAQGNSSVNAPGIMRTTVSNKRIGLGGTQLEKSRVVLVPNHFHLFEHLHTYGLRQPTEIEQPDVDILGDNPNPGATLNTVRLLGGNVGFPGQFRVSLGQHLHGGIRKVSSSLPVGPESPKSYYDNTAVYAGGNSTGFLPSPIVPGASNSQTTWSKTSLQMRSSGTSGEHAAGNGHIDQATTLGGAGQGNTYGSNLSSLHDIDHRPQHLGMLKLIKVKHATSPTTEILQPS